MRAPARRAAARACKRQSQRVTRWSPVLDTCFQPEPEQMGHMPVPDFIVCVCTSAIVTTPIASSLTLHPQGEIAQVQRPIRLCRCCGDSQVVVDERGN